MPGAFLWTRRVHPVENPARLWRGATGAGRRGSRGDDLDGQRERHVAVQLGEHLVGAHVLDVLIEHELLAIKLDAALLAHGVDVNAKRALWDCNDTPLHGAVERNDIEMARLLLDAGANPAIRDDKFKSTALGWAEFFGHKELAALLRERGVRS